MALQKLKELDSGASGNYWKLTKFMIDAQALRLQAQLELFLNQEKADSAAPSLDSIGFSMDLTKEQLCGNLVALMYGFIKANDDRFSDAQDV